jgi:hemerythrin superfamily protein
MPTKKSIDATKLLKQDHNKVKAMFEEIEALSPRSSTKRRELFEEIKTELEVHTRIEEEIFYPACRELRSKEAKELVLEANEEHGLAKMLLKQLEEVGSDDETFKAKMKVLKDVVLHHAREEEREMFTTAREYMEKEELEELGEQLSRRKEYLMSGGLGEAEVESDEIEDEDQEDYERATM